MTNLTNTTTPFGPADIAFAFQYDFLNFAAGDSISYTTTLSLNGGAVAPIPEPSTMLLFGTGMLGLIGYAWRRRTLGV